MLESPVLPILVAGAVDNREQHNMKTGSKIVIMGFALFGMAIIVLLFGSFWADDRAYAQIDKFDEFIVTGAAMDQTIAKLNNDLIDKKSHDAILDDEWVVMTAIGEHADALRDAKSVLGKEPTTLYATEIRGLFNTITKANDVVTVIPFSGHHIATVEMRYEMIHKFETRYRDYRTCLGYSIQIDGKTFKLH